MNQKLNSSSTENLEIFWRLSVECGRVAATPGENMMRCSPINSKAAAITHLTMSLKDAADIPTMIQRRVGVQFSDGSCPKGREFFIMWNSSQKTA